jgi:hypothetical protein
MPSIVLIQNGKLYKCVSPKLLFETQSEDFKRRKAKLKFIRIVVNVKKKFGIECFSLL